MAILGLGTDIVEIARIEAVVARSGDRLAKRVLSPNEWALYEAHQQPVRFLAKRFAVKEAAAKRSAPAFATASHSINSKCSMMSLGNRACACGVKLSSWQSGWACVLCTSRWRMNATTLVRR